MVYIGVIHFFTKLKNEKCRLNFIFLTSIENEKQISCNSFFNFHFFSEARKMKNELSVWLIYFLTSSKNEKQIPCGSFFKSIFFWKNEKWIEFLLNFSFFVKKMEMKKMENFSVN